MGIWHGNNQKGVLNEFTLEDIKGAAATIVIAGNDTVRHAYTSVKPRRLTLLLDSSYGHALSPLPDAEPRGTAQGTGGD